MEQINAVLRVDATRLNLPLAGLHARVGHSFVVMMTGVPADVTHLYVRLFRPDGAYHDISANERRTNGVWTAYAIGTCFAEAGSARYEIHATDARGNPTALGGGALHIEPFSASTNPTEPGARVTVCEIPTKDGAMVQVCMVRDEAGQWVYEAITPETEVTK